MVANPQELAVQEYRMMDRLEAELRLNYQEIETPLVHRFTKGMYSRQILLPAGTKTVTKIHNTQHQYVILCGRCAVSTDGENFEEVVGPMLGVTEPGTQRFIIVYEPTIWITFHPNPEDEHDLAKIEEKIIRKHEIPQELLSGSTPIQLENEESLK